MALTAPNSTKPTVIDGDDMANAMSDPKVTTLIAASVEYGARLHAAGRDHSVDSDD
jgi:hypothetical protein